MGELKRSAQMSSKPDPKEFLKALAYNPNSVTRIRYKAGEPFKPKREVSRSRSHARSRSNISSSRNSQKQSQYSKSSKDSSKPSPRYSDLSMTQQDEIFRLPHAIPAIATAYEPAAGVSKFSKAQPKTDGAC